MSVINRRFCPLQMVSVPKNGLLYGWCKEFDETAISLVMPLSEEKCYPGAGTADTSACLAIAQVERFVVVNAVVSVHEDAVPRRESPVDTTLGHSWFERWTFGLNILSVSGEISEFDDDFK